jgi:UDP-N-acetylmuramoyl-tripeptide--D-alanyl-D-alanine ligase
MTDNQLDLLYSRYRSSTGATDNPVSPKRGSLYFALQKRKPNTKMYLFVWHAWRIMELYAPFLKRLAVFMGSKSRWAVELEAAPDRQYDGNAYVRRALQNGAALAVVDRRSKHRPPATLLVEDATDALYQLARRHRPQIHSPIVAITGTMGKTTTTILVHAVLNHELEAFLGQGENSPQSQAFYILNMPKSSQAGVFEMGSVRPGIIRSSCEIARPTHGLITAVGLAHLDTFKDLETIRRSKWEMFEFLSETQGRIFLNCNQPWLATQGRSLNNAIRYGSQAGSDVIGTIVSADPFLKVRWHHDAQAAPVEIQTLLAGQHNLDNVLAAIAAGLDFGISTASIKDALEAFQPITDRSEIFYWGSNRVYNESYSATPASTLANITSFGQFSAARKLLILGPVSRTPLDHPVYDEVIALVQHLNFDQVILLSERYDRFRKLDVGLHLLGRAELQEWLLANPQDGTDIMIKAYGEYELKRCFQTP